MSDPIQQQLISARRNQILDAAAVVFAAKGFHSTTTRDIARQAGIAEGTIYNYFASKSALLLGLFERMRASVIEHLPPVPPDADVRTFLRMLLAQPLGALEADDLGLFRVVIAEMMSSEELRRLYHEQIMLPTLEMAEAFLAERGVPSGRSLSAALTVRAVSGMVLGLLIERAMGDPLVIEQWQMLPDVLADLLWHGLQPGG